MRKHFLVALLFISLVPKANAANVWWQSQMGVAIETVFTTPINTVHLPGTAAVIEGHLRPFDPNTGLDQNMPDDLKQSLRVEFYYPNRQTPIVANLSSAYEFSFTTPTLLAGSSNIFTIKVIKVNSILKSYYQQQADLQASLAHYQDPNYIDPYKGPIIDNLKVRLQTTALQIAANEQILNSIDLPIVVSNAVPAPNLVESMLFQGFNFVATLNQGLSVDGQTVLISSKLTDNRNKYDALLKGSNAAPKWKIEYYFNGNLLSTDGPRALGENVIAASSFTTPALSFLTQNQFKMILYNIDGTKTYKVAAFTVNVPVSENVVQPTATPMPTATPNPTMQPTPTPVPDTQAPVVVIQNQDGIFTNQSVLNLNVLVSDTSSTTSHVYRNNVDIFQSTAPAFTAPVTLLEGLNILTVISIDSYGNTSQPVGLYNVVKDTTPPVLTNLLPANGATSGSLSLNLSGLSNEPLSSIFVNGQPLTLSADKYSFSGTLTLSASGASQLNWLATDLAGNNTAVASTISVDSIPAVIASTLIDNQLNANPLISVPVTITKDNGSTVTTDFYLNGAKVYSTNLLQFTAQIALNVGQNSLVIKATKANGLASVPLSYQDLVYNPQALTAASPNGTTLISPSVTIATTLSQQFINKTSTTTTLAALLSNQTDSISCVNGVSLTPPTSTLGLSQFDIFTEVTPDVQQLADRLQTADQAFFFVRDQIQFLPRFGAIQTASQTLNSGYGTAIDKTAALIALYKAMGIDARFVFGDTYIEEKKLMDLFQVSSTNDLAWAMQLSLRGYFQKLYPVNFEPSQMVFYNQGHRVWQVPHAWAYAKIQVSPGNFQWLELDTMSVENDLLRNNSTSISVNLNATLTNYLTVIDGVSSSTLGKYLKFDIFSDWLGKTYNLSFHDLGVKNYGTQVTGLSVFSDYSGLISSNISNRSPCIKNISEVVPTQFQFQSYFRAGEQASPYLTYQIPLAVVSKDSLKITHSAGVSGDIGTNGQTGQILFSSNNQVLATSSLIDSNATFNLYHAIQEPIEYGGASSARITPNLVASGVHAVTHSIAPKNENNYFDMLNTYLVEANQPSSSSELLFKEFRLATTYALTHSADSEEFLGIAFSAVRFSENLMVFTSQDGLINSDAVSSLKYVPNQGQLDWETAGPLYSKSGGNTNFLNYTNLASAKGILIVSNSSMENRVWEDLFGINAVSAVKVIQTAAQNNSIATQPHMQLVTGSTVSNSLVLNTNNLFKAAMQPYLALIGSFSSESPILYSVTDQTQVGQWSGVGFILLPTSPLGHAGAFIGAGGATPLLGGYTADSVQCANGQPPTVTTSTTLQRDPYSGSIDYNFGYLVSCGGINILITEHCLGGPATIGECQVCHTHYLETNGTRICELLNSSVGTLPSLPAADSAFASSIPALPPITPPSLDTGATNSVPQALFIELNPSGCKAMSSQNCDLSPNNSLSSQGSCSIGKPVNTESGAMWHEFVDVDLKGRTDGTELLFKRTYLAQDTALSLNGDFGPHWKHNFETRILTLTPEVDPAAFGPAFPSIVWIDENGGAWTFLRTGANPNLKSPEGFAGTLTEGSTSYEIKTHDGKRYVYYRNDPIIKAGVLKQIIDPHGDAISFAYDSAGLLANISAPFAGRLVFSRNAQGKISQVLRERDNLQISFNYDAQGNLLNSTDIDGLITSYEYNQGQQNTKASGLLSAIQDPIGRRIEFTYYDNGRVYEQKEAGGAYRAFAYSDPRSAIHFTRVKDLDGNVTEFQFNSNGQTVKIIYPDLTFTENTWSQGNLIKVSDEEAFVSTYGFDASRNIISVSSPEKNINLTYQSVGNLNKIQSISDGSKITGFTINGAGDTLTETCTSASLQTKYTVDSFGNILTVNNGRGTYSFTRDGNGFATGIPDAHNPEARTYDTRGRVTTRTFASGQVIQIQYDNRDRVTRIDDSTGPSIVNTYDIMGRLTLQSVTDGTTPQMTSFLYDDRDRLIQKTDSMGRKTKFVYDKVAVGCNVVDKPAKIIDAANRITQFEYDNRQRLIRSMDAEGNITRYEYNFRGDLIALTDPSGNRTVWTYGGSHKPLSRLRPSVTIVNGSAVATTEVTNYIYNSVNNLTRIEQGLGTTGAVKNVIEFTYNNLEQITRKVLKREQNNVVISTSDDSSFTYENQLDATLLKSAVNNVQNIQFASEALPPFNKTSFSVTASTSGNPLGLIQGNFNINYGNSGQVTSITDASNNLALYSATYDNAGRMTQILSNYFGNNAYTSVLYDTFGRKRGAVHSTGMMGSFSYDQANRLTSVYWDGMAIPNGPNEHFVEQLAYNNQTGNIDQITREFGVQNFSYDSIDQLTGYSFTSNNSVPNLQNQLLTRTHQYDRTGNRISDSMNGTGSFLANTILSDSVYNYSVDPDARGNRTARTNLQTNATETYAYREDGKEVRYDNQNLTAEYFFDALGRRVAKRFTNKLDNSQFTQAYLHETDQDKILMGKNGNNDLTIYLDGQNVDEHFLEVNAQGAKAYISDHLGSVLNTDAAGSVHGFSPWGERLDSSPIAVVSSPSSPIAYGLAGRDLNPISLSYNDRNRTLDPFTAGFTTQDPIFPNSGPNTHEYALNNPISYVDPLGLSSVTFNAATGTLTVYSGTGQTIGTFRASNNVDSRAPAGPAPEGVFAYISHQTHPESNSSGQYGLNGNFVFDFPNGSGIGVHSGRVGVPDGLGRSGYQHATSGCIRTTDSATSLLNSLELSDPLTSIQVVR